MVTAYFREDWHYSAEELKKEFHYDSDEKFIGFVKSLISYGVIKKTTREWVDDEDEVEGVYQGFYDDAFAEDDTCYKFPFVGIAVCHNRIVYVYPKYIGRIDAPLNHFPKDELRTIVKVITKYSQKKAKQDVQDIDLFDDIATKGKSNILPVIFFILEDYAAYGLYEKEETILEDNGTGEIYWQKTVDETFPIISDNEPYYVNLYTLRNVNDETDFIKRLHAYIVCKCAEEIKNTKLTEFFSLPNVDLPEVNGDEFSDKVYVLDRIMAELNTVFEDRKIRLLKAMYTYIAKGKSLTGENEVHLIGTRSFNLVWEWVCQQVFESENEKVLENVLENVKIDYTKLDIKLGSKPPTLIKLIECPTWAKITPEGVVSVKASKTLIPDYLKFEAKTFPGNKKKYFLYILDAKYYCPIWTDKCISRQPGIDDIVKQYMYFLAYKNVRNSLGITYDIKNYFVMPKRKDVYFDKGSASLEFLHKDEISKDLGWGRIEIRMIDPEVMYDACLNDKHFPLTDLDERFCELDKAKDGNVYAIEEYRDMDKKAAEPPQMK